MDTYSKADTRNKARENAGFVQTADKALLGSIGSKGRQLGATKGSVAKPVVLLIEKSIDAFLASAAR